MAKQEMGETQYDPYEKDTQRQPSIAELMKHHKRVKANISGEAIPGDAEEEEEEESDETIVPENMTVAELKEALDEAGIEYKSDDKKADLVTLYSDYLADNQ
jgi:hypothetical protein